MNYIFKLVMFFFIGAIALAVMTHSQGFARSAGTLFSGVNAMGGTLTGAGTAQKG